MSGISVVIVTYLPGNELVDCVRALDENIGCPKEIIISDNSPSTPEILDRISIDYDNILIISNSLNPGFAAGNNAGAAIAKYPILLFINPDTILKSRLDKPEDYLTQNTGIVSGYCVDQKGKYKRTAGRFPTNPLRLLVFSLRFDGRTPLKYGNFSTPKAYVDYTEGSLYLIKLETFIACRGFDENIFLYGEDYEFSYRIHISGLRNYISRDIVYMHIGGFSQGKEQLVVNGLLFFARKHLSIINFASIWTMLTLRCSILLCLYSFLALFAQSRRKRIPHIINSLRRCFRG